MAETRFCPNCGPRELDIHGRCSGCGSDQTVLYFAGDADTIRSQSYPRKGLELGLSSPGTDEVDTALERISKNEQQRTSR